MVASRLRLAGIFLILCFVTPLVSSYWIIKMNAFVIGFGFFGDPVIKKTLGFLNQRVPDWKKCLDLQKYGAAS